MKHYGSWSLTPDILQLLPREGKVISENIKFR